MDELRVRLLTEMELRLSDKKRQFSTMPLLLGVMLHRYYKSLILDSKQTLFTPQQKADAVHTLNALLEKAGGAGETGAALPPESVGDSASASAAQRTLVPLPGASAPQAAAYRDNELEAWKHLPPDALTHKQFWSTQLNGVEARFKKMARVARSVLGVPNSNAECERDFSLAKYLLSPQRKSMSGDVFARKMFLIKNRHLWTPNPELDEPPAPRRRHRCAAASAR